MNRIGHRWLHCAAALCHGNEKLRSAMMENVMNILVNQIPPAPKPSLMDTHRWVGFGLGHGDTGHLQVNRPKGCERQSLEAREGQTTKTI